MFKVECDSCRAGYDLDERRVPEQGMRMRCPKCGASFVVHRPAGNAPLSSTQTFPGAHEPADGGPPPAPPTLFGQRAPAAPDVQDDAVAPRGRTAVGVAPPATDDSVIVDLPRPKVSHGPLPVTASAPPPAAASSLPRGTLVGAKAHVASTSAAPSDPGTAAGAFGSNLTPARTLVGSAPTPAGAAHPPPPAPLGLQPAPHAAEPLLAPVQDKDLSVSNIRIDQLPMPEADFDLPEPEPEAVARATEVVDLPAVKGAAPVRPASHARTAPGAVPPLGAAPPRAVAPALGAPPPTRTAVGVAPARAQSVTDLPALKGGGDLPAVKHATVGFGQVGVPTPKATPGTAHAHPQSYGNIDLPGLAPPRGTPGSVDLPRLKGTAPGTGDFGGAQLPELPAPGDLPRLRQSRPDAAETSFGDLELPELPSSGELPRLKPAKTTAPDFGAEPTGSPGMRLGKTAVDEASFGDMELPDLPAPRSTLQRPGLDEADFGDIDLPPPRAGAEVVPPKEPTMEGFGGLPRAPITADFGSPSPAAGAGADSDLPPSLLGPDDETSFGDLGMGDAPGKGTAAAAPLDSLPPSLRDTADEIDLEDGIADSAPERAEEEPQEVDAEPEPVEADGEGTAYDAAADDEPGEGDAKPRDEGTEMELGMEGGEEEGQTDGKFSLPPEILRRQRGEDFEAKEAQRRRRTIAILVRLLVVALLIVGAGVGTGFLTNYGMFGVFFLERYFPDAGDAVFARGTIERAESLAATDTYADVRRALTELGRARRQKGLNRLVLTRSVVHHALYMVRFGDDAGSASRIAAILRRLEERGFEAEGMELAFAADAARRKAWDEASSHLEKARAATRGEDAYLELTAAETAYAQGRFDVAEKAFQAALKACSCARAQWGLTRILLKKDSRDPQVREEQSRAIGETLRLSPAHVEARIAEARLHWMQGQEERALNDLRIALGLDPTEEDKRLWPAKSALADGYSALGYVHEARGRLPLARQAYDKAIQADAFRVEALLGQARVLARESRYSDALARFDSAIGIATKGGDNPVMLSGRKADAELQLGKARALMHVDRGQEAREILTKLSTDLPNDPEIVLALGEAEQALGHPDIAEAHFRKSIELAPTTFAGYLALSQHFFKLKEPDKASAVLNEAATKVVETAEMRRALGRSELERNKLESAAHEFGRALELDPHDIEAMFGLGRALRKLGQLDRARSLLDTIAARDPAFAGLVEERGLLSEARGDFQGAVKLYQNALTKEPSDTPLILRLGAAQLAAGDYDAAEQTLGKVIRETPNSAEAEYFIGRLAFARGRTPDALTHFTRAVTLDSGKAEYHLWVARASLDMANLGRTMEEVAATLELDPGVGDAYWLKAAVEARIGQVKDCLKNLDKALKLNPVRTEAYAVRGDCYDQLGQLRDGIASYRIALDRLPDNGEWWFKIGRLHMNLGSVGDSNAALRRAMEIGDKTEPMPYWLPEVYRMSAENAEQAGNRAVAINHYKRYYQIVDESQDVDRKPIRKKLKEWGVEVE
jgi:predicted Zn finger-like uncharacterized protein